MADLDKLAKDEELKVQNAELYSANQITKKRNLLLEQLHTKDATLIKELMFQLKAYKTDKQADRKQLHDQSKSSEKMIQDLEIKLQAAENATNDMEMQKDKELRQQQDKYEAELKKKENQILDLQQKENDYDKFLNEKSNMQATIDEYTKKFEAEKALRIDQVQ